MTPEAIKKAVKEGMEETMRDFWIEREIHYQDHLFIQGVRKGATQVRKGSLYALGSALIGFIVWVFTMAWTAFKSGG